MHAQIKLTCSFEDALDKVTASLAEQGFGVITRIDMHKTLAEKLGVEFRNYTILGACNPVLAHQALLANPEIGLLLPCNVVVENTTSGALVRLPDAAELMHGGTGNADPALAGLVVDANDRLARVAQALTD
ncbi:DUF302 domain-containing protein [Aliisedimentitalea scapharcae]|uniref:DUF302 domain-containing protein n=1 Tax=Aliisedimentitalea scapharcae TaxID=1524259 RepID=A0ABZ2XNF0_9RHOB